MSGYGQLNLNLLITVYFYSANYLPSIGVRVLINNISASIPQLKPRDLASSKPGYPEQAHASRVAARNGPGTRDSESL